MSALTDLFTALANKIRSKTGGSATYTPPQMVNAIDDVYAAGVAAGETTHTQTYTPAANTAANDMGITHDYRYVNTSGMIVPSGAKSITANGSGIDVSSYATANVNVPNPTLSGDATAADVKSGKTFYGNNYTKQTGTYVEPTIINIEPNNLDPTNLQIGSNYKPIATGYAIASYSEITPSNTSPVSLANRNFYKAMAEGYAISSYTSISQSQLDAGVYFSSGMKKMPSSGYAYSSQQSLYNLTKAATIKNGGTGSTTQSFTAVVNRRYLVIAVRFSSSGTASNAGISSGATVDTQFINNQSTSSGQGKLWAAIVKATATTVTMLGSNVVCCYMPLDD